ncbi:energy transducer TonB [Telmatobacter bradus]|uniref:energy transducer TonB n=1 Tax=Telmatobacter bradus TaxID=474953 RepID=UPI003B429BF2
MPNENPIQAENQPTLLATASAEDELVHSLMGTSLEEKPIWADLWESFQDVFFPKKLPPLELTSKPIDVPDRMAVKRNPVAVAIAATVNVAILLIVLFAVGKKVIQNIQQKQMIALDVNSDFKLDAKLQKDRAGGGGGGGSHSELDASKGKLPPRAQDPIIAPQVKRIDNPKIAMEPTINVQQEIQLPDNPQMVNFGVKNSSVKLASNGTGSGGGIGSGTGGGIGSGRGNGYGPGTGGNTGGGVYKLGGGDKQPVLIHSVEAEFSDEARRNKYQGVCVIQIIIDAQGMPQNPRVVRSLGMGLDEKAIEAVKLYRFRPAMKDGKTPVPVLMNIEVNFHLY